MNLCSIEFFTGAGGLALGLEMAGCHHEAMFEFNGQVCGTIRYNIAHHQPLAEKWNIHQMDVRDVRYTELFKSIELVAGGPPCQPFSLGGKARGRNDSRDMFLEAVRAVRELCPKCFVFDTLHPGREWASRLQPNSAGQLEVAELAKHFIENHYHCV